MFELIPMTHFNRSFRNPFAEMDNLARAFFNEPFFSANAEIRPFRTDIKKTEDGFQLEAELPGFAREDISVDIENELLTISAERKSENEEKKDSFVRRERFYGSFKRSFDISGIDADRISAAYTDGVLSLDMPKKQELLPRSRKLEIQ